MSYVVLARKWRPRTFADLVGQEHVSRTIANAIAAERVAHAFLFTGVRGVGKTTSARILAKSLNCAEGPTAEPCLRCGPCTDIESGRDVDVQEIDAASNTGIDDVKRLQETLPYRPARDRFKILIVDEVHMLSKPAWNAFLKTLEEPPPHVKFIFATTEADKVPNTILSRCQRYDFKLIETLEIAKRLHYVLSEEKVEAEPEGVQIIAKEAAGSMRDAMSLLDQVIAWAGQGEEVLGADVVSRVLGVAKRSVQHALAGAVVDGDPSRCLDLVQEVVGQGFGIPAVARDFLAYLRDLVVAKVSRDPGALLQFADQELSSLVELAKRSEQDDLSRLYLAFSRSYDEVIRSSQPRSAFEMTLVRLAGRPSLLPVDELLRRLAALEARVVSGGGGRGGGGGQGGGGAPGPSGGVPGPSRGRSQDAVSRRSASAAEAVPGRQPASPPRSGAARKAAPEARREAPNHVGQAPIQPANPNRPQGSPSPGSEPQLGQRPQVDRAQLGSLGKPAAAQMAAAANPLAEPAAKGAKEQKNIPGSSSARGSAPTAGKEPEEHARAKSVPKKENEAKQRTAPVESAGLEGTSFASPLAESTLGVLRELLRRVADKRAGVASMFEHASPVCVDQERVIFAFEPGSFLLSQVREVGGIELMQTAVQEQFGEATHFEVVSDGRHANVQTVAAFDAAAREAAVEAARKRVIEHPLVRAAMEELGAELRDVRLPQ
jgi:DNA polymerase III subunit gamma/tau